MYRLSSCVWEITLACCFSCRYCGSKGGHARENELTTEECLSVADQLAELGCRRVSLIGGEVFMRPDWDRIAKRLTDRGVDVAVITNGFLFSEEMTARLKNAGITSVAVSVDGPEDVHDEYRQKGSFQRAREAVRVLGAAGIPVSVITTLHSGNAGRLEELYEQMKSWPIWAWQIQACSPMGNAASGMDYRFDAGSVIRFILEHAFSAPFVIGAADNIGYYTEGEGYLRGNLSGFAMFSGCRAGLSSIGIDSVGNVRGCESMYDDVFIEGNLRARPLREIWEDPAAFAYNRGFTTERLTGRCGGCKYGKYCRGGCRSYDHFVHGKLYESPMCARREEPGNPASERPDHHGACFDTI